MSQGKSPKITFGVTPDDQHWADAEKRYASARHKRNERGKGGRGKGKGSGSDTSYGSRYDASRYGSTASPPPGSNGSTISASAASSAEHGSFEPWVMEDDNVSVERSESSLEE